MKTPHKPNRVERVTIWIGSVSSLIVHTLFFIAAFGAGFLGIAVWNSVFNILTTVVSLEAIYLAIFIQMTVNHNTASLREVEEDVEEINEEIEDISEDVEDIQEEIEDIGEDVEEISEDVEDIQEDIEEKEKNKK